MIPFPIYVTLIALQSSYQDVWIKRLGYEPAEYRTAVAETLHAV